MRRSLPKRLQRRPQTRTRRPPVNRLRPQRRRQSQIRRPQTVIRQPRKIMMQRVIAQSHRRPQLGPKRARRIDRIRQLLQPRHRLPIALISMRPQRPKCVHESGRRHHPIPNRKGPHRQPPPRCQRDDQSPRQQYRHLRHDRLTRSVPRRSRTRRRWRRSCRPTPARARASPPLRVAHSAAAARRWCRPDRRGRCRPSSACR